MAYSNWQYCGVNQVNYNPNLRMIQNQRFDEELYQNCRIDEPDYDIPISYSKPIEEVLYMAPKCPEKPLCYPIVTPSPQMRKKRSMSMFYPDLPPRNPPKQEEQPFKRYNIRGSSKSLNKLPMPSKDKSTDTPKVSSPPKTLRRQNTFTVKLSPDRLPEIFRSRTQSIRSIFSSKPKDTMSLNPFGEHSRRRFPRLHLPKFLKRK